uniref:Uncharacterized protein n=1 Tax=Meloidogyne hapla TaxID=6305 RepID=A0A1I8C1C1_MELHA
MLFVYYWLEQLFYTNFYEINLNVLLNPELIKLFFENETTKIPLQFHCKEAILRASNYNCKSVLDFVQNYLVTAYYVKFNFWMVGNTEQFNDNFLNLFNGGTKEFHFQCIKRPTLYDMIINYIETTINYSTMIRRVVFDHINWPRNDLTISERAEKIKRYREVDYISGNYQLANRYNPNVRFWISHRERHETILYIDIRRIYF